MTENLENKMSIELSYKPLYRQIYDILYQRITSGVYKIGEERRPESLAAGSAFPFPPSARQWGFWWKGIDPQAGVGTL